VKNPDIIKAEITKLIALCPELEEDEALRHDMIEAETETFGFLSSLLRTIGAAEATVEGTSAYIADLHVRVDRLERRRESLRRLIMKIMETAELKKIELAEATIFVRAGTPKVVVVNEREVPDEFMRIKKEPDKSLIKAALSAHENVPGAMLSNAEPVLNIKKR